MNTAHNTNATEYTTFAEFEAAGQGGILAYVEHRKSIREAKRAERDARDATCDLTWEEVRTGVLFEAEAAVGPVNYRNRLEIHRIAAHNDKIAAAHGG